MLGLDQSLVRRTNQPNQQLRAWHERAHQVGLQPELEGAFDLPQVQRCGYRNVKGEAGEGYGQIHVLRQIQRVLEVQDAARGGVPADPRPIAHR